MTLAVELPNNHTSSFTCWIFKVLVEVINFSHNFQAFVVQNAVRICHEFNAWLVKNERFVFPQTKSYKYFIILLQLNTIVYLARLDVLRQKQTASWHRFLGSRVQINSKQRFNGFILPVRKKKSVVHVGRVRLDQVCLLYQDKAGLSQCQDLTSHAAQCCQLFPPALALTTPSRSVATTATCYLYCCTATSISIKKIKVSTLRFIINLCY